MNGDSFLSSSTNNLKWVQKSFSKWIHQETKKKQKQNEPQTVILQHVKSLLSEFIEWGFSHLSLDWELFPFGSSQLLSSSSSPSSLHTESDFDLLFCCTSLKDSFILERSCFFSTFQIFLQAQKKTHISEIHYVKNAFVPSFTFRLLLPSGSFDIDLLFAHLDSSWLKDQTWMDCLFHPKHFSSLDSKTALSVSGVRVTTSIEHLVNQQFPETTKKQQFFDFVCTIKFWAKQRKIYSNALGFLGGVSWFLLCLKVFQMFPESESVSELCIRFFQTWTEWPWPHPVIVHPTKEEKKEEEEKHSHPCFSRGQSFLPIVLPVYPFAYSTYNLCLSTATSVLFEWRQANEQIKHMLSSPVRSSFSWSSVFSEIDFFRSFSHFLRIRIASDSLVHTEWKGWVLSRIRYLILHLEQNPFLIVRPFTQSFTRSEQKEKEKEEEEHQVTDFYIGFLIHTKKWKKLKQKKTQPQKELDLSLEVTQFKEMVLYQFPSRNEHTKIEVIHQFPSEIDENVSNMKSMKDKDKDLLKKKMSLDEFQKTSSSSFPSSSSSSLFHPNFQEEVTHPIHVRLSLQVR